MTVLAGRYEITKKLDEGGFGITFLARDTMQPSQPLCVVKKLSHNQTNPEFIKRITEKFKQEANILEKLGIHTQIPQLLAYFQQHSNFYIVQEFIEGQNIEKEILGNKRNEVYVRNLLQEVLKVLSFVHQQGVIHLDIKPANLMRSRKDGRIFLIDFGAVKELMLNTQGKFASSARTSLPIGTPGYMPTEQSLGQPRFASDVYAVGMTAIAALSGVQPHELEEDPHTGEVIWSNQAQVSKDLAEVITKMVRRHHSLRYTSAEDALQALNSLRPLTPYVSTPQQTSSKPQRQPAPTPVVSKVLQQKPLNLPSQLTPKPLKTLLTPTIPSHNTQNDFPRRKILGFILAGASLIAVGLVPIISNSSIKARIYEGKSYAGSMNRTQQAYYVENNKFASNIKHLRLGIKLKKNDYSVKTVPQSNDKSVMNIVQAKDKKLKSYIGLVYFRKLGDRDDLLAKLCETSQSLSKPPVMPKLAKNAKYDDIKCPSGFKAIL